MKKGTSNFKKGDYILTIPFGVCRVRGVRWIDGGKVYNVKISKKSREKFFIQESLIHGLAKSQRFS